jgi:hypothetical protein
MKGNCKQRRQLQEQQRNRSSVVVRNAISFFRFLYLTKTHQKPDFTGRTHQKTEFTGQNTNITFMLQKYYGNAALFISFRRCTSAHSASASCISFRVLVSLHLSHLWLHELSMREECV